MDRGRRRTEPPACRAGQPPTSRAPSGLFLSCPRSWGWRRGERACHVAGSAAAGASRCLSCLPPSPMRGRGRSTEALRPCAGRRSAQHRAAARQQGLAGANWRARGRGRRRRRATGSVSLVRQASGRAANGERRAVNGIGRPDTRAGGCGQRHRTAPQGALTGLATGPWSDSSRQLPDGRAEVAE